MNLRDAHVKTEYEAPNGECLLRSLAVARGGTATGVGKGATARLAAKYILIPQSERTIPYRDLASLTGNA
jgi:hypothetical protein